MEKWSVSGRGDQDFLLKFGPSSRQVSRVKKKTKANSRFQGGPITPCGCAWPGSRESSAGLGWGTSATLLGGGTRGGGRLGFVLFAGFRGGNAPTEANSNLKTDGHL